MKVDWWTVVLQTINVLALAWLLHRFLYRPVRQVLADRRARTTRMLDDVRDAQARVQAEQAALAAQQVELATARTRAIDEAQAAGAAERARVLARIDMEAGQRAQAAHAALVAERAAAETALADAASNLAVDIARRLLEPLGPQAAFDAFLTAACHDVQALHRPDEGGAPIPIEVASAMPLDDDERTRCRQRLAAVLGVEPQLRWSVEPSLIAGLELRLPFGTVRSHWSGNLAGIREALRRDVHAA